MKFDIQLSSDHGAVINAIRGFAQKMKAFA